MEHELCRQDLQVHFPALLSVVLKYQVGNRPQALLGGTLQYQVENGPQVLLGEAAQNQGNCTKRDKKRVNTYSPDE